MMVSVLVALLRTYEVYDVSTTARGRPWITLIIGLGGAGACDLAAASYIHPYNGDSSHSSSRLPTMRHSLRSITTEDPRGS